MKTRVACLLATMALAAGLLVVAVLPPASAAPLTSPSTTWIDNFDGPPLNSRWSWMNEDPAYWSLTERPGFLRIITQQQKNNYLIQDAPVGDYAIETHLFFEPTENFQQGGLALYLDDNNQLSLVRAFCGYPRCVANGVYYDVNEGGVALTYMLATTVQDEIWLRIVRQGNVYTGYASENGTDWTEVGAPAVGYTPNKIGLRAGNNFQPVGEIPADFDYFSLVDHSYRIMLPLVLRGD